jgi:hypothetical protein
MEGADPAPLRFDDKKLYLITAGSAVAIRQEFKFRTGLTQGNQTKYLGFAVTQAITNYQLPITNYQLPITE